MKVTGLQGKRNAFQYAGPYVDMVEVTQEEKMSMPTGRKNNSLLVLERTPVQRADPQKSGGERKRKKNGQCKKKPGRKIGLSSVSQFEGDNVRVEQIV